MFVFRLILLLTLPGLLQSSQLGAQPSSQEGGSHHELTIYTIPSAAGFDWESPASLYKSVIRNYVSTMFRKESYMLGHVFFRLSSPLLDNPLYAGIAVESRKEQRQLVLKDRIGYAILGAPMPGRMETTDELLDKIDFFSRKNELAFISYRISKEAFLRITEFLEVFTTKFDDEHAPSDFYGGAFWPLYEREGSGCTALGMALLELAGLPAKQREDWKIQLNIPMELVGGEFNENRRINPRTIRRSPAWHNGEGLENIDYVPFEIYSPCLIYQWVLDHHHPAENARLTDAEPLVKNGIPGLYIDMSQVAINPEKPIFTHRPQSSLFISHYLKMIGSSHQQIARELNLPVMPAF